MSPVSKSMKALKVPYVTMADYLLKQTEQTVGNTLPELETNQLATRTRQR